MRGARARSFLCPLLQYDSAAAEFEAERVLQQSGESTLVRVYNSKELLEYSIGRVREVQGNNQGAREAYGRALVENLAFYPGHTALARLALATSDTTTALAEPYFVKPYFPLAYVREGQGKDSLAIGYYAQFIALAPAAYARQVEDARQRLSDVKRLVSESR